MYLKVQNPNALAVATLKLTGAYRLFVPAAGSAFATNPNEPIHLGHIRAPAETTNITRKTIDTAVYGAVVTVLDLVTKVEETGTFESASADDLLIRGLWAGSKPVGGGPSGAAAFQANHLYALNDLVTPTTPNGNYYKVTTAGTSSGTEPVAWKTDGTTNTSGTVTFTDQGAIPAASSLTVVKNNHGTTSGMLIDVYLSAITGGNTEIFVAPAANLSGDGYGAGRDGTNETTLKFAYTLLSAGAYQIPATLGSFGTEQVKGGYNLLGVTPGTEDAVIDKIIAGYITP